MYDGPYTAFSLSDLEATRDELLFEVHKMSQADAGGSMTDKTVSTKLQVTWCLVLTELPFNRV